MHLVLLRRLWRLNVRPSICAQSNIWHSYGYQSLGCTRGARYLQSAGFRTGINAQDDEISKTTAFLAELGYNEVISKGIIAALLSPESGVSVDNLYSVTKGLAGAYEIGEDGGLIPLAKAVEQDIALQEGREEVGFAVKLPDSADVLECKGLEGMSLKNVIEYGSDENCSVLGEYLECACNGIMACSTCHVYVSQDWLARLNKVCPLSDEELDMIDLAFEPRNNSRLGCQIKLCKDIEGIELEVPSSSYNLFDHIPFKD